MRENWSMKLEANSIIYQQQQQVEAAAAAAAARNSRQQQQTVATSRYHRAAIDGYVDMLCDASKRDTNLPTGEDGLTPTLLAAQSGHLDALRILVGRGGDPERTCADGSSALHLASVRGHLNCVSFLVNFGVNMWSLDNDLHTAKDVAAIEQRKEVLDFLDSMMAKQSALNTRNVQKLKEKAKVAAEKRLKLLRKAQLKAIKQVEKDERYLKKLSHNRRLLKAAHSISDIKLVGRSQCSHKAAAAAAAAGYLSSGETGGGGSSISSSSRLSSSPSLANLINHKLQMDLLMGRSRYNPQAISHQPPRLLSRRSTGTTGSCATTTTITTTTTDESSAYSTSSVSSHLSSSGGRTSPKRPKYSDLVAVNGAELARWQQQRKPPQSLSSTSSCAQEQQSLKSTSAGSTMGTKFWGIGGVSRKVQLRRLLRAGAAQSSSDLTNITSSTGGQQLQDSTTSTNQSALNDVEPNILANLDNTGCGGSSAGNGRSGKLCNVQPTMRLKLNAAVERNQDPSTDQAETLMAPQMMTRAVSEPDFRAALRQDKDDDDDDDDVDEHGPSDQEAQEAQARRPVSQTSGSRLAKESQLELPNDTPVPENQCQNGVDFSSREASRMTKQQANRADSQHQLLTQCLSQLKLRHEELTMRNQEGEELQGRRNNQAQQQMPLRPSKLAHRARAFLISRQISGGGGGDFFDSSDELIKHQLMAGEFPLRPSLIKQKQQQQQQQQQTGDQMPGLKGYSGYDGNGQHQNIDNDNNNNNNNNDNRAGGCPRGEGSTAISVDSIGSASSFAKRNASSSSACSGAKSDLSSSSASYSSSSSSSSTSKCSNSSSVETAAPATNHINDGQTMEAALQPMMAHHHRLSPSPPTAGPLLPPQPPPLPPKTLSLEAATAAINGRLANQRLQPQLKPRVPNNDINNHDTESTIETFLESNGLEDLGEVFSREKIDLEALMLLDEDDLKSLNILLGPRRKLLKAIATRKRWAKSRKGGGEINSNNNVTKPMYIMVDTQL